MRMFGTRGVSESDERGGLRGRLLGQDRPAEPADPPAPRDLQHRPVKATYDPAVVSEAGGTAQDPAASPEGDATRGSPTPDDAERAATRPVSRPPARLISRPGPGDTPGTAAPEARVRRRAWDLDSGAADAGPPSWQASSTGATEATGDPAAGHGAAAEARPRRRDPSVPSSAPAPEAAEVALARAHLARLREMGGGTPEALPGQTPPHGGGARARTRVLGFHGREMADDDPMSRGAAATQAGPAWPVGWIVVTAGPGRGASFTLVAGVSSIGRNPDQAIALDFGDLAISREAHASIAYDERDNRFLLGHGGKANLVRLNGRPVVSTEDLADGDEIAIGDTVLRFVALCGGGFSWAASDAVPRDGAEAAGQGADGGQAVRGPGA